MRLEAVHSFQRWLRRQVQCSRKLENAQTDENYDCYGVNDDGRWHILLSYGSVS